jgi:hypothetical protein
MVDARAEILRNRRQKLDKLEDVLPARRVLTEVGPSLSKLFIKLIIAQISSPASQGYERHHELDCPASSMARNFQGASTRGVVTRRWNFTNELVTTCWALLFSTARQWTK